MVGKPAVLNDLERMTAAVKGEWQRERLMTGIIWVVSAAW
jgi:hypothetical protein